MYGQKQIISCLMVVVLVALINFYKTVIKRDKENRQYAEQNRQDRMVHQEELNRALEIEQQVANRNAFMTKWLEYGDHCCDLHALIFRPSEYERTTDNVWSKSNSVDNIGAENITSEEDFGEDNVPTMRCSVTRAAEEEMATITSQNCLGLDKKVQLDHGGGGDKVAGDLSGGIIYVAVFVLLVSLGKAAYDLSKQFKELQKTKTLSEDEVLRRCSLQEYSLIKHKQKQSAKALEPFIKKTGIVLRPQLSLDSGAEQSHLKQCEFVRRISTDYHNGSGLISEPGTPVKPGKLLAGRPAPLVRRCSVPVFVNQHLGTSRRPSMESFSEDDSSAIPTETKRRVRMIHRH